MIKLRQKYLDPRKLEKLEKNLVYPEPHIPGLREILSLRSLGLFINGLWKIWLGKEEK